jgi:hypothetical protein
MKIIKIVFCFLVALTLSSYAVAKPIVSQDFSGVYDCQGLDAHEGAYKGIVSLSLDPSHSTAQYASYHFKLEVQGFGIYRGVAVGEADKMAIHFALDKPNTQDHGTGLATFSKTSQGKHQFHKFYYQPEYQGGNHGIEDCVQR